MARREEGRWLLRMEDLDLPRVIPRCADDILRSLEVLGFWWDGAVMYQSRRGDFYENAMERLKRAGLMYPCSCSRAEIARIASAPHGEEGVVYPGTCRGGLAVGKVERAWRVRVVDEVIGFDDGVMGVYSQNLAGLCGDFVVKRADGPYSYHLAVVVDDADCGVNQVVRGGDLLSSTTRQIYLQRLLGYSTPAYAHLPLVCNSDGTKLSKRDHAVSIGAGVDLRKEGGRLLLAALRFLGQSPPHTLDHAPCNEIFSWAFAMFDPGSIPRESGPIPT